MVFFVICRPAMWVIKLIGGRRRCGKTTAVMVILMELWAQVGVPSYSIWSEYTAPDTDCSVAPTLSRKHDGSPCWRPEFVRMTEHGHLWHPNGVHILIVPHPSLQGTCESLWVTSSTFFTGSFMAQLNCPLVLIMTTLEAPSCFVCLKWCRDKDSESIQAIWNGNLFACLCLFSIFGPSTLS